MTPYASRGKHRQRGFTLIEVLIASGISLLISVAATATFLFGTKICRTTSEETLMRHRVATVMEWMKENLMRASTRAVYELHTTLEDEALEAWQPGRYLRFFDPSTDTWHIVYWVPDTRTLCRAEGTSLPAPHPENDAWHSDVDNFSVTLMGDGTLDYSVRIVPSNYITGKTRASWVEISSRTFPRNYVE